jgi:MarR family transcriptional regulator, lower aerobic nicotinate degradation pathway regulator
MSERAKAISSPLRVAPSPPLRGRDEEGGKAPQQLVSPLPDPPPQGGRGSALLRGETEYRLEDQVGFILRRAHQRATVIFNAVMAKFSITPTQFAALAKLLDLGTVSQNELGRLTAMDPATIFGVVGRLIKRGFIIQSVNAKDARLVILELTEAGRTAATAMKAAAAEVSRQTLEPLTEDERALFLQMLQRLATNGSNDA